jgi:hypothetical protein
MNHSFSFEELAGAGSDEAPIFEPDLVLEQV